MRPRTTAKQGDGHMVVFTAWRHWLKSFSRALWGRQCGPMPPIRNKPRHRIGLERLEDRLAPATRWVDNTPAGTFFTASGGDQPATVGPLMPGTDLFSTIGAAVAAASPGDTINVSDGTYNELVTVNKANLLIQGNFFNTDAQIRSGANETVLNGNAGTSSFYVTASDVTIAGFT